MRALALVAPLALVALLAGCLSALEAGVPAAVAAPALPPSVEGRVWLPPSTGEGRVETLVPLPGLPAGASVFAVVTLSGYYGVDAPPVLADVVVELRDAAGGVLADAHVSLEAPEAELEAVMPASGDAALALLSYGGSDEEAFGDRVDYAVSFK